MKNRPLFSLALSMIIFGTIGIFRRYIPLSSGIIAFSRGIIGATFIFAFIWITKKPFSLKKIRDKILLLCVSGALMGFNWILLFESYNYTSVAAATLCYYMAPIIVILFSPLFFGERLGAKKLFCIGGAFLGMILVSGVIKSGVSFSEAKGVFLGLGAAVLYAAVVIMNKKLGNIPAYEKTSVQLISSAAAILPYIFFAEDFSAFKNTGTGAVLMLIFVGIVHTGIVYVLYFGSIGKLKAQTTAILSYIDPVTAILLSALVLRENIGFLEIAGAVLILGSTLISETTVNKKSNK